MGTVSLSLQMSGINREQFIKNCLKLTSSKTTRDGKTSKSGTDLPNGIFIENVKLSQRVIYYYQTTIWEILLKKSRIYV